MDQNERRQLLPVQAELFEEDAEADKHGLKQATDPPDMPDFEPAIEEPIN